MKKRIILMRHGKSDWEADYSRDHERPLARRGVDAARRMGGLLAESGQFPELVVSSSAVRARTTAELALEGAQGADHQPLIVTKRLYDAHPDQVLEEIQMLPDKHDSVMLVGHEPTWSLTAGMLIGGAAMKFPTASMARIDFRVQGWRNVEPGGGELVWHLQPRFFSTP